jgi:hypothetical protein
MRVSVGRFEAPTRTSCQEDHVGMVVVGDATCVSLHFDGAESCAT